MGGVVISVALIISFLLRATFQDSPKSSLRFDGATGKFKIVAFADLHFGENAWENWGPEQDRKSDRVMSYILDAEKPDLVVFLGDVLTANNLPVKNATKYWKQATEATAKRSIPWAAVFGNHDDMPFEWPAQWFGPSGVPGASPGHYAYFQGTSRAELMEEDLKSAFSVSVQGPPSLWPSVSNFALPIASHRKPGSTAALLYLMDSGGGSYPQVISAKQASWFRDVSAALNPDNQTQELVFWHIPSKAYESVAPKPSSPIAAPCIGSLNEENVASQSAEWGIMGILAKRPSAKAVVVGHNHGLDWCCPGSGGLWLCFARHSGYGGYGSWTRGARVIELSENSGEKPRTWIRLEDGRVVGELELDKSATRHPRHDADS
ncbi:LOW QUALITY PROTEIN: probable inactive purple acid phosphatase 16 [Selaginella moellendorffii]|uniref:LOW QUALITY PROTEIN: probable inactive purple acid phosphatase 16 n=1 Tax=Selaginella moellendorffii TaxID=88036 RepID=UPI000D1CBABC|nr:LOW QUALITY PROTEIN: probable inactive purple acid phosphatase 16 [Selaginella moellendorffii]|eukprot:XP_002988005.2 LOW QUALITY PROTEIN: probable inactive purple acid phosphatase 16 [Selaginella moellendorffii]